MTNNIPNKTIVKLFLLYIVIHLISCGEDYTPEQEKYINGIEIYRQEKDNYMQNDPGSPFNYKRKISFEPLKYYDPDPEFVFKSRLYEYEKKDTIVIFGTKGEKRKVIKYGLVKFTYKGNEFKVNVYEGTSNTGEVYHSIWFTDKTTGEETYGVGRYLDFEMNHDNNFIYTIDFNLAYNPYCAYSPEYSCAIPSGEDFINLAIEAGEMNYH